MAQYCGVPGEIVVKADDVAAVRAARSWYGPGSCNLVDLRAHAARTSRIQDHPLAARLEADAVPIYDCHHIRAHAVSQQERREIMAEWIAVLRDGAGIVILEHAFADTGPVDQVSAVFEQIIAGQRQSSTVAGDHFAKAGANDRIWNALEKLCLQAPDAFAAYYANDIIALVCEAWLGPAYQITSQVNVVNPGGASQTPHRDYHLGSQSPEIVQRYPEHVHLFSPMLTLQGAVAHCDMLLESGPTLYIPFTQTYGPGYLAAQDSAIRGWFGKNRLQLPLRKGDAVFFNPALLHAAGANHSAEIRRMANLLQVSSAYGRAMETTDRARMSETLYPVLRRLSRSNTLSAAETANVMAACAEGYAFPRNLDRGPPIGGLAPKSQQVLMQESLAADLSTEQFVMALHGQAERKLG